MGVRLVGEVVGWLLSPAADGLTAAERLVLVVIAERAHDQSREMWRHRGDGMNLHDRIAAAIGSPDGLKKVLRRLAERGLEVRVPLGVDKAGRPVFAVKGRPVKFRLPELPASVTIPERGDDRASIEPDPETPMGDPEGPHSESMQDPQAPHSDERGADKAPIGQQRGPLRAPLITYKASTSKTNPSTPVVPSHVAEVEGGPPGRREPSAQDPPTYRQPPLMIAVPDLDTAYDDARDALQALGPDAMDTWITAAHAALGDAPTRQLVIHAHRLALDRRPA